MTTDALVAVFTNYSKTKPNEINCAHYLPTTKTKQIISIIETLVDYDST